MSKVPRFLVDPNDPLSIVQQASEIQLVVDGRIEFGDPSHPEDPTSTAAAGVTAASHPGNVQNILGSWVEVSFTAEDTAVTCYHNLFSDPVYTVPVTGEPNVRWLLFGFSSDGDASIANGVWSACFVEGDTVTVNSIQLRLQGSSINTTHPVTATFFFTPAVRGFVET